MSKVLSLAVLLCLTSCISYSGLQTSQKLQRENNFETAMQENQAFTLRSAKYNYRHVLKKIKEETLKQAEQAKIDAINQKIKELKEKK